ncbi:uncharacterized protein LAESUDRAFT_708456 [Laetiporus sulphureus 93-53]|uniref:BTB domain-containing protein n=1 Tax=Laetiporus sulphureus 93-53 TaxID=1314785 RepID=A0A165BCF6_9APHY|nr:uncharacterized protein LAESUDRAFT_708456 [Laetiporus sulphureus 93-53]KZT00735.1 hypothetical protein LAESUDRAFT_708456 [Laetiporus sulphureus 93-53]
MAPSTAAPPALQEATRRSTVTWQDDLKALFDHAKDRFPDVVWELFDEQDMNSRGVEEIWGHKAIVYARAPPSFQARYFSFKPPPPVSPLPYSTSPTGTLPVQSALSLPLPLNVDYPSVSRSPSPYQAPSPSPSANTGAVLHIPIPINPTLFSGELEYLYTGKGFGEAFEFLFDSSDSREDGDGEEARIDKLRKDLVFMWRSRLYSDVRIALTGSFSSTNHENSSAIFSSHRFILVSRTPYFQTQLLSWGVNQKPGEPLTLTLPSPPFTPPSLHFTLGFLYTGTLAFSNRTFDLDTAFHIMRSAAYLSLDTLYDEVQARIVQEMMHGLFHAFLEFSEYEAITGGRWGTGGCRCRQCARRAPRVLEFSLQDDVKNTHLERGARRALVGLFGEGWCTQEFAHLPQKTRDGLLKGLAKRSTPMNVFPLLYAAHAALNKLNTVIDSWGDIVKDMVHTARKTIDDVLCSQAEACFEQPEWLVIMESDGARFEDAQRVDWIMDAVRQGMNEKNAAMLYQILVSSVLLRPHPTEVEEAMLSPTSHVRVSVEQTRVDVCRWLRRRWLNVKQEGGFDGLEPWAAQEICHEIEITMDDMYGAVAPTTTQRAGARASTRNSAVKGDDESVSMYSLRTGGPNRSTKQSGDPTRGSSGSVRSIARSTHSTLSKAGPASLPRRSTLQSSHRPDSKLTPDRSNGLTTRSIRSIHTAGDDMKTYDARSSVSVSGSSTRRNASSATSPHERASKARSSTTSINSQTTTSTVRKTTPGSSSLRPSSALSRPASTTSITSANISEASTAFETAKSDLRAGSLGRSRRGSTTSSLSTTSARTTGTSTPRVARSRPPSTATRTSTGAPSVKVNRPPPSPVDHMRSSPATRRTLSSTPSVRSAVSTASVTTTRRPARGSSKESQQAANGKTERTPKTAADDATGDVKGKNRASAVRVHEKEGSAASTSTIRESLKRKTSSDTIKEVTDTLKANDIPRGATLDIGIPCIISSKKARFRAYARYIGEVEGERGPWVGVEVPVDDSWPEDKLDGRQWHDGTWGGIRYFDIGSPSEWDYGDDRMARRRRFDWVNNLGRDAKGTLKREGDQLSIDRAKRFRSVSPSVSDASNSESRGLFVRPQQVLYVVDAVGSDL